MADPLDLSNLHEVINAPFPAATKQTAGVINGVKTDVMSIGFADKILVTVSQKGKLAHWVRALAKIHTHTCHTLISLSAPCTTRKSEPWN